MPAIRPLILLAILALFCTGLKAAPDDLPAAPVAPSTTADVLKPLLAAIEDDAARARLITALRAATANGSNGAVSLPTRVPTIDIADTSFGRTLADQTIAVVNQIETLAHRAAAGIGGLYNGTYVVNWPDLADYFRQLAIVASIVVIVAILLRRPVRHIRRQLAGRCDDAHPWKKWLLAGGVLVTYLVHVVLSAGAGYVAALIVGHGTLQLMQSLFLNAYFLATSVIAVLRTVFSPREPRLRLIPCGDKIARAWSFRLCTINAFLTYGLLLFVPIVNFAVTFAVGIAMRLAIVTISLIATLWLLYSHRREVSDGITALAERQEEPGHRIAFHLAARLWQPIAWGYAVIFYVIWITRPLEAISYLAVGSTQTVLTVMIAFALSAAIGRRFENGIKVSADITEMFPNLNARINLFMPVLEQLLRVLVIIAAVASILDAWNIINISAYLSTAAGRQVVTEWISAAAILAVSFILWLIATSWIELKLNPHGRRRPTARVRTLFALFRNAFTITLAVIAIMLTLSALGLDIAPLLAGAGVLGLAIGFGSQRLVQDIITGAFIQFENIMNEGDSVTVAGVSGTVERLSIRSVGLRDMHGVYHVIPFSSVTSVSNSVRGFAYHVAEVPVGLDTDIELAKQAMVAAFEELKTMPPGSHIIDGIDMHGLVQLSNNGALLRARIKTTPGNQWSVGRAYTELLKRHLDARNIKIPSALTYQYLAGSKGGDAEMAAGPE